MISTPAADSVDAQSSLGIRLINAAAAHATSSRHRKSARATRSTAAAATGSSLFAAAGVSAASPPAAELDSPLFDPAAFPADQFLADSSSSSVHKASKKSFK